MFWQQIRANKRSSIMLLVIMASVLVLLGYVLGLAFGANPQAGMFGALIAAVVWLVLVMISFSSGDRILLAASNAKKVTPDVHPMLFNVVEEMTIAAQLPKIPDIYIIDDPAPNAFATGRSPKSASVAVTAGLLARLNRDQLQGVIAHEISHIVHRDIMFVTLAGVMLGTIVLLANMFMRSMFYSAMFGGYSRRRYSSRSGGSGGGQAIFLLIAILAAILAPIFAQILYFALSRRREYLADAGGAKLTRYPQGLAEALEKISGAHIPQKTANQVTAPMYISAPFTGKQVASLFSTHPPIDERIKILRSMQQGASYKDYAEAAGTVNSRLAAQIPKTDLADEQPVGLRETSAVAAGTAGPAEHKREKAQVHRETGDIIRKLNGFTFVKCTCGVTLKLPPNYKPSKVTCPRCGHVSPAK